VQIVAEIAREILARCEHGRHRRRMLEGFRISDVPVEKSDRCFGATLSACSCGRSVRRRMRVSRDSMVLIPMQHTKLRPRA